MTPTMWGKYCNQTINPLFCTVNSTNFVQNVSEIKLYNQTIKNFICKNNFETSCHGNGEPKVYSLELSGAAEDLSISAMDVRFNVTPFNNNNIANGINLMCFARHGAIPSAVLHDFSGNIDKAPLIIPSPKVGRWYITILPFNISKEVGGVETTSIKVCYSMELKVHECPMGKAGSNCTWEKYNLQVGMLIT